ncbi:MAG: SDR family NAD(P)-dependent oxidoreductase [Rhodospirillaceae bacterium]|nr:MAG: SDR family NAD(P)-dependent oxidoreductase [Rhodospirillaceae bacterium]
MAGVLAGRVALVTGASAGIGVAVAIALAEAGASVAVAARRADRLTALVKKIEAAGGKALAVPGDVTDEKAARGMVADTVKHFGRLDILVNNAGVIQLATVENANIAEWKQVIDLNLMAALYTCTAAIPHMKAHGGGDIVNVSSMASRRTSAMYNSYSTSKHALNAMTDGMRQELGLAGIRVSIVEPGATDTEVAEQMTDPQHQEWMRKHTSKDGAMKPEDVAAAILLVVSLPARTNISELSIRPTIDVGPSR